MLRLGIKYKCNLQHNNIIQGNSYEGRSKRIIILVVAVLAVTAAGISIVAVISKDKKLISSTVYLKRIVLKFACDDGVSKLFIMKACPELSFRSVEHIGEGAFNDCNDNLQSMGKKAHMLKAMQSLII